MLKIESTPYGYRIINNGYIRVADAQAFFEDTKRLVSSRGMKKFGILVDLRGQTAAPPDAAAVIMQQMRWIREQGLERSAVVVDSAIAQMQTERMQRETGIGAVARSYDASSDPEWESKAVAWVTKGEEKPPAKR